MAYTPQIGSAAYRLFRKLPKRVQKQLIRSIPRFYLALGVVREGQPPGGYYITAAVEAVAAPQMRLRSASGDASLLRSQ
jgi:hypothetical protein